MNIRLDPVNAAKRPILENLLELYVHDLSAAFEVDIGPDGRFGYPKLDLYFGAPDGHHAYFIRRGDDLAGFALVTRGSPATADPDDLDVAEYFVLRRYRRTKIGREAAHLLWRAHPGRWVVRVSDVNRGAHDFWQRTVDAFVGARVAPGSHAGKKHPFRVYVFESSGARDAPARSEIAALPEIGRSGRGGF